MDNVLTKTFNLEVTSRSLSVLSLSPSLQAGHFHSEALLPQLFPSPSSDPESGVPSVSSVGDTLAPGHRDFTPFHYTLAPHLETNLISISVATATPPPNPPIRPRSSRACFSKDKKAKRCLPQSPSPAPPGLSSPPLQPPSRPARPLPAPRPSAKHTVARSGAGDGRALPPVRMPPLRLAGSSVCGIVR